MQIAKIFGLSVLGFLLLCSAIWGVMAINYSGPANNLIRYAIVGAFAVLALGTLIAEFIPAYRWQMMGAYVCVFVGVLLWWFALTPSNNREWQPNVAVLPYATVEGNMVTMHNIRNTEYRTETDYTPRYYDRTFDVSKLQSVDVIATYWMGPSVAHIFLSFGFPNDQYLAVSIETRMDTSQSYSTIGGFFRQFDLIYVVADERDVIRLRTDFRKDPLEQVHVYRSKGSLENGQRLFMEYVKQINALKEKPAFYNSLVTNCTTAIWSNSLVNATHVPFNWKIMATGYLPEYLYGLGRLETDGLSFPELEKRAHINARAQAAGDGEDFSRLIRETGSFTPVSTKPAP